MFFAYSVADNPAVAFALLAGPLLLLVGVMTLISSSLTVRPPWLAMAGASAVSVLCAASVVGWYARVDPTAANAPWGNLWAYSLLLAITGAAVLGLLSLRRTLTIAGLPSWLSVVLAMACGCSAVAALAFALLSPFALVALNLLVLTAAVLLARRSTASMSGAQADSLVGR